MSAFGLIGVFCDLGSHGVLTYSQLLRDPKFSLGGDGLTLVLKSVVNGVLVAKSPTGALLSVPHGLRPDGGLLGRPGESSSNILTTFVDIQILNTICVVVVII